MTYSLCEPNGRTKIAGKSRTMPCSFWIPSSFPITPALLTPATTLGSLFLLPAVALLSGCATTGLDRLFVVRAGVYCRVPYAQHEKPRWDFETYKMLAYRERPPPDGLKPGGRRPLWWEAKGRLASAINVPRSRQTPRGRPVRLPICNRVERRTFRTRRLVSHRAGRRPCFDITALKEELRRSPTVLPCCTKG